MPCFKLFCLLPPGSTDGPGKPGCSVGTFHLVPCWTEVPEGRAARVPKGVSWAKHGRLPRQRRLSNWRWCVGQREKFLLRFSHPAAGWPPRAKPRAARSTGHAGSCSPPWRRRVSEAGRRQSGEAEALRGKGLNPLGF